MRATTIVNDGMKKKKLTISELGSSAKINPPSDAFSLIEFCYFSLVNSAPICIIRRILNLSRT